MNNFKKKLSALTVLALSGVVATNTVACGKTHTSDTVIDLSTLKFGPIENKVADPAAVTEPDCEAIKDTIAKSVQAVLDDAIKGAVEGTDYTLDLTNLVPGDLHAGIEITINAIEASKLLTSHANIQVTFVAK